eukprot:SAG22_NODE_16424_length_325_cov_1.132743_2_plen_38_part_01
MGTAAGIKAVISALVNNPSSATITEPAIKALAALCGLG